MSLLELEASVINYSQLNRKQYIEMNDCKSPLINSWSIKTCALSNLY